MLELDTTGSNDTALIDRLSDYNHRRIDARNEAYAKLVPELLAVARDKKSHWRYVLSATVSTGIHSMLTQYKAGGAKVFPSSVS